MDREEAKEHTDLESCYKLKVLYEGLNMDDIEKTKELFPKGSRASANYFEGIVWMQVLVTSEQTEGMHTVANVTFEPGGRTNWHTHPLGQVLLVTEGEGFYQERGKPAQRLVKGSVVAIPKNTEHWHGASKDKSLVHVAVSNIESGISVTWLLPVKDEEYERVHI